MNYHYQREIEPIGDPINNVINKAFSIKFKNELYQEIYKHLNFEEKKEIFLMAIEKCKCYEYFTTIVKNLFEYISTDEDGEPTKYDLRLYKIITINLLRIVEERYKKEVNNLIINSFEEKDFDMEEMNP